MQFLQKFARFFLLMLVFGYFQDFEVSLADEISDLKRKLEYLEAKERLDTELQLLEAQVKSKRQEIQELTSGYQDVLTDAPKAGTVSSEPAPATEPESVETAAPVESGKREWVANVVNAGTCHPWRIDAESLHVGGDGTFSFVARNSRDNWKGTYNGNLKDSTAKCGPCGNNARAADFKSEWIDEKWEVSLKMAWAGGSCRILFNLE